MIGVVPDQLPGSAVSVSPCLGVPEIVGGDVFCGAVAATAVPTPVNAKIAIATNVFLAWLPTDNRTSTRRYRSITGWMHFHADDVREKEVSLIR